MKFLRFSIFLVVLPLLSFGLVHKFYVSVSNITYSEKDQAIQITTRLFIDDVEQLLYERYGIEGKMATANETKAVDLYLEKYLNTKFLVYLDGKKVDYKLLGKKYDNDVVICFIEIDGIDIDLYKTIEVQNTVLTDLFEEQQNVVHFKIKGRKKSFVLIRENYKGMLKL